MEKRLILGVWGSLVMLLCLMALVGMTGSANAFLPRGTLTPFPQQTPMLSDHFQRGIIFFQNQRFAAAEFHFTQVLQIQAEFTEAYVNRGLSRAALGNHIQAVQDFTVVLAADPSRDDVYYQRGLSLVQMGNTGAALTDFDQAIELQRVASYYYARGHLYLAIEDRQTALLDFQQFLVLADVTDARRPEVTTLLSELSNPAN